MITCKRIIKRRKELWEEYRDIEHDREYVQSVAKYILEHEHIRTEIQENPDYLIEMCFVVVDKDKETIPFFLNKVQQIFISKLKKAISDFKAGKRKHLKFLILKGRQQGFTTAITAYQLACSLTKRNFAGFTLADDAENTETIFEDKAKYPYNQLPEELKPTEKYNNRREFHFEKLNSRWRVATAAGKGVGRSKTLNFFHGSEAAFWDAINDVLTAIGPAFTKDCIQILESTPNGFNEFKDLWDDDNNWEPLFFAWWLTDEYRLQFTNSAEKNQFIHNVDNHELHNSEEIRKIYKKIKHLRDVEKLEWEQLHWYFDKWKDLKEYINQEYPCYPEEAFLASGANVFDKEKVTERIAVLKKRYTSNEPVRGYFTWRNHGEQIFDPSIRFVEDPSGHITIYKHPEPKVPYVIGGDIAEGGADLSAAHVLNNLTGEQVAVWHGHADTDIYAKDMYCLGKYYNTALIAIEMNFDLHPVKELIRLNYLLQYRRENIDTRTNQKSDKYGFRTTTITRPVIISQLISVVRDEIDTINDIPTLQEMLTFVRNDDGKPEAIQGKHDDLVMSLAIAHKAREQQTMDVDNSVKAWVAQPDTEKHVDFDTEEEQEYSESYSESTFW
jgi:hypothetical protein